MIVNAIGFLLIKPAWEGGGGGIIGRWGCLGDILLSLDSSSATKDILI